MKRLELLERLERTDLRDKRSIGVELDPAHGELVEPLKLATAYVKAVSTDFVLAG